MRKFVLLAFAVCFTLLVAGFGRAEDTTAKGIVDKALKAHGGEDKIAKYTARVEKAKGTVFVGDGIAFTMEAYYRYPNQLRENVELEKDGQQATINAVFNGDKGWVQAGDQTEEAGAKKITSFKEAARLAQLAGLSGLKDPANQLAALADIKVEGRPAAGVKISTKGYRDVSLYFDKETGLLVKSEREALDIDSGDTFREEIYYSKCKEMNGIQTPMKAVAYRNGEKFSEQEATEIKYLEKIEEKLFEKP